MINLAHAIAANLGLAIWVEIQTDSPVCTYYFGPFLSRSSAEAAVEGYKEDLLQEGAQNLRVKIQRSKEPEVLTVTEDWGAYSRTASPSPMFSGQL
ncbi:DUF1816 domain-containing protein [Synechococcus elongatus]|uniref:DUF1816 domain-containing protein n=2 Tax=Synechococcus elongatus TaxID=32046 RepID=Q31LC1_SYNE7|nr:DUF1816 domain-containing protein [Synechococcus elongatus]ABB58148.1 conserved hypothetical protein [Synechococcus elongatus PCC 7942 = FACHB-805]AJD57376.1 hypothetical protein M744_05785 [Synechococcus elongatus UTEX 2973]MBD2586867.1 DUF1816 domain-containing protein [Synechococcus elongatus FACHB-242]MBD2687938.1 DUF1816 domain-containing protein [Synechococcus elongatus FACHB-1061]MBD2706351.1 DUF1816 domain-containing protein [Synechococcus elongatus PCC 7942 = FACHB-805]